MNPVNKTINGPLEKCFNSAVVLIQAETDQHIMLYYKVLFV